MSGANSSHAAEGRSPPPVRCTTLTPQLQSNILQLQSNILQLQSNILQLQSNILQLQKQLGHSDASGQSLTSPTKLSRPTTSE
jgi:cell division protein FtsL